VGLEPADLVDQHHDGPGLVEHRAGSAVLVGLDDVDDRVVGAQEENGVALGRDLRSHGDGYRDRADSAMTPIQLCPIPMNLRYRRARCAAANVHARVQTASTLLPSGRGGNAAQWTRAMRWMLAIVVLASACGTPDKLDESKVGTCQRV
jgi:hypothetical protein